MTPAERLQTQEIRLVEILHKAAVLKASDIHITAGSRPVVRIDGKITPLMEYPILTPEMTQRLLYSVMSEKHRKQLEEKGQVDFSFGVGVKPMDNLKVGMDIRFINWKKAKGYKDFQWKDQLVLALGGEFKPMQKLALRAGYNFGRSPIRGGVKDIMNANNIPNFVRPFSDFDIAFFNLIGFPAITEHHITLGLGYEFTKNFSIDLAYEHAFKKKVSATDNMNLGLFVEAQNAQNAITIGLNWKF